MFSFYILLIIILIIIVIYTLPITIKICFNSCGSNFILNIYIYILRFIRIGFFDINYKRIDENDRMEMLLKIFGIKVLSMMVDAANLTIKDKKPVIKYKIHKAFFLKFPKKVEDKKMFSFHDIYRMSNLFYSNKKVIYETSLNIKKSIVIRIFNLNIKEGFNDAALTSILYGIINSMVYTIFVPIYCNIRFLNKPSISISPYFGRNIFESNFNCILDFRYGNIIVNSIKFIKNFKWR